MEKQEVVVIKQSSDITLNWDGLDGQKIISGSILLENGEKIVLGDAILRLIEQSLLSLQNKSILHLESDDEYVSAERAAGLLQVSRPTIYAWQDSGKLSVLERNGRRLVPLVDILKMKAEGKKEAAPKQRRRRRKSDVTQEENELITASNTSISLEQEYEGILRRLKQKSQIAK